MKLVGKKEVFVASMVLVLLSPLHASGREGGFLVDYKNNLHRQLLIKVPDGESITVEDDFSVLGEGSSVIAHVYPFEILKGKFWSQPLNMEIFRDIPSGSPVKRSALGDEDHRAVRDSGVFEWRRVENERRIDRISRLRDELNRKRETGERISSRLDAVRDAEYAAERKLFRTEEVNSKRIWAIEEDIDDILREIEDLSDDREELWRVREQFAGEIPKPKAEINGLTDRISTITRSIKKKRGDVLHLKERKRHLIDEIWDARRKLREILLDLREVEEALRGVKEEMERLDVELGDELRKIERESP